MSKDIGITVKKNENFSEWYTQVILKAQLADYAPIKGFIVVMPYGYSIWEKIKEYLDKKIKETGHKNAYFPALIPESLLRKEAEHFKGFTPEVFWVTHAGDTELSEKYAIRPTSETIVYESYAKWVRSWRDLPIRLNFWNSVFRAEIKSTKPFIRTSEFLWQEGHTVHATKEEAEEEVMLMLNVYKELIQDYLAIPVIEGKKSEREKFLGALYTATLEAIMPDGKALQMGTSHNLGENFSRSFGIKYIGKDEKEHYAWQTCWGVSWRLIGAMVMAHGDDRGLVLPPKIAPIQAIIIPIIYKDVNKTEILSKAKKVLDELQNHGISALLDDRDQYTPGWKFHEWELKGIPVRIEIGPKDLQDRCITISRRDTFERITIKDEELINRMLKLLDEIQSNLFNKAKKLLEEHITVAYDYSQFIEILENKGGFIKACWCGRTECEDKIKEETGATIRVIPFKTEKVFSSCIYCKKEAKEVVYFAKAY
ncbi:MAG: proline--tRNA ligase [Candidatus Bathyarchaeia archaeon]